MPTTGLIPARYRTAKSPVMEADARAVHFESAATQRLRINTTPVTTYPFTLACWVKLARIDVVGNIPLSIADDVSGTGDMHRLVVIPTGQVYAQEFTNTTLSATTTQKVTLNQWQHLVAVYASASSRTVFLNGYQDTGTNTSSHTATSGIDHVDIGATDRAGTINAPFNGEIAHACIWSTALTQNEAHQLYMGQSPLEVRGGFLERWWPLTEGSGLRDYVGNNQLTAYNSPGWGAAFDKFKRNWRMLTADDAGGGGGGTPAFPFRRRQPRPRITDWWGDQVHVTTPYSVGGWH